MLLSEEYDWYRANESELNEASLSRFNTHYTKGNIIAFISGYRHENTPAQNKANNKAIEALLRGAGFGYNHVEGHYVEDKVNGVDNVEASFGVYCSPEQEETLFNLLKGIARKFHQDSFLFVGKTEDGQAPDKRPAYYYTPSGHIDMKFTRWTPKVTGQYFTKIGNKEFMFEKLSDFEMPILGTNNGKIIVSQGRDLIVNEGADYYISNKLAMGEYLIYA